MKTGFYYKCRHTSEMGVTAATAQRAILPNVKRVDFELTSEDGMIDLSSHNALKRPLYESRIFEVDLLVTAENLHMLQYKLASIAAWLTGSGDLIFDDCPSVIWDAKVYSEIGYVPERRGKKAILKINFEVKAFSRAMFTSDDGPMIGDDLLLCYKIPIGLPRALIYDISTSGNEFDVINIGTAPTKPKITIESNQGRNATMYVTVDINGRKMAFKATTDGVTVFDMETGRMTVNGEGATPSDGTILELLPGNNKMCVSADEGATIKISYIPKFMYCWEVY